MSSLEPSATGGDARAMADPAQVDAELAVLGACLLNEPAIDAVVDEGLRPHHLGSWRHQALFGAILVLHHEGRSVDPITVNDRLDQQGALVDVGGREYVHTLLATSFICQRARSYAQIILRRHRERARERIGEELQAGEIGAEEASRRLQELEGDGDA